MKLIRRAISLVVIVLLFSSWAVTNVSAHALLVRSNPEANVVLESPPIQVELFFSAPPPQELSESVLKFLHRWLGLPNPSQEQEKRLETCQIPWHRPPGQVWQHRTCGPVQVSGGAKMDFQNTLSRPSWFEQFMGIRIARAHNVPSDWWSVPITGGAPTRLTRLQTINLFAGLSPDQKHLVSMSGEGLFVIELDGSNLTQLLSDWGVFGTVSWIP